MNEDMLVKRGVLDPCVGVTIRVAVQSSALLPNGKTMPGYVQFDFIENGKNTRSTSREQLLAEGWDIPDFSGLPQGNYTFV